MEPLTYTVSAVAQLLGISRSKAYDLVAQGALPVVPLAGRRKLVPRVAVERLVGAPVPRLVHARHQHAHRHASRRPHDNDTPADRGRRSPLSKQRDRDLWAPSFCAGSRPTRLRRPAWVSTVLCRSIMDRPGSRLGS